MVFLIYENNNFIKKTEKYPRKNISEPLSENTNLKFYVLLDNIPEYDPDFQKIVKKDIELTEDNYNEYQHLYIAYQLYEVISMDKSIIITKLNNSLAMHLDTNYHIALREKHTFELAYTKVTGKRQQDLLELRDWLDRCRLERDTREFEYINNNTLPSFEWEDKPLIN